MDDAGGNSLVVQWLGLRTFNALAQDQSLVGEQGSCKSRGTAKTKQNTTIKKKKKTNTGYSWSKSSDRKEWKLKLRFQFLDEES